MSQETSLNRSQNSFKATGYVYEKAAIGKGGVPLPLELEDCEVEIYKDGKPTGEKVEAQRLKGRVTLKTDNGIFPFNLFFTSVNRNGEPSKMWDMALKILDWNPIIKGDGSEPDYVTLQGNVSNYDSYSQRTGKVVPRLQYNVRQASHSDPESAPSGVTVQGTAFVQKIGPELVHDEETGRMIANCYMAEYNGSVFPITLIAAEGDAAEFFDSEIEVGGTFDFEAERVMRHIGSTRINKRKAFGKSSQDMSRSYDVEELLATAGNMMDEPEPEYDEDGNEKPDTSGYLNPNAVKKAIKERNRMVEEMEANGGKTGDEDEDEKPVRKSAAKKSETEPKKSGFGKKSPPAEPYDDGDEPW